MWCAYRFTFANAGADALVLRDLGNTVHEFSEAILNHFQGQGHWVAATARATDGGIDIWYSMPQRPGDAEFAPIWEAQLKAHGLAAQRVIGRN